MAPLIVCGEGHNLYKSPCVAWLSRASVEWVKNLFRSWSCRPQPKSRSMTKRNGRGVILSYYINFGRYERHSCKNLVCIVCMRNIAEHHIHSTGGSKVMKLLDSLTMYKSMPWNSAWLFVISNIYTLEKQIAYQMINKRTPHSTVEKQCHSWIYNSAMSQTNYSLFVFTAN